MSGASAVNFLGANIIRLLKSITFAPTHAQLHLIVSAFERIAGPSIDVLVGSDPVRRSKIYQSQGVPRKLEGLIRPRRASLEFAETERRAGDPPGRPTAIVSTENNRHANFCHYAILQQW